METVAKRIQYLLTRELLTLNELAKYLEISLSMLTAIVRDNQAPELEVAILIAEYFGVSLDWLVTGRGHIERHEEYDYSPHILRKDKELSGKIQINLNDSVELPTGEVVDERREDFKSPYIKEIIASIRELNPDQRVKALKLIKLTFDLENN
ncbi:MAG TPA: XRE family transcriptional regulator [Bacteroidetes bacterium]|nr:XRE family transcriptional regulator [Bacteroidota bacterium]